MSLFGRLFGKESAMSPKPVDVRSQVQDVENILKPRIADFQDRTKIHYILIFPVMHKVAVRLLVEDFGLDATLRQYEALVSSLCSDGTIRESQFKSFGWPEVPPQEVTHVQELDTTLWRLTRELVGQGFLKEAVAQAFINVALVASSKMDAMLAAGFIITILKELRAGVHTPAPEVRPEPPESVDEVTKLIFVQVRDLAYLTKERSGLEWQHLLPSLQRRCAISCIQYRGHDGTLALFRDQIAKLAPVLDQSPRNPPQNLPLTPLHVTNMATFNDVLQQFAATTSESAEIHPLYVAHALSMLVVDLALKHYDTIFLSSILMSCCADIERGQYGFVTKTH